MTESLHYTDADYDRAGVDPDEVRWDLQHAKDDFSPRAEEYRQQVVKADTQARHANDGGQDYGG